MVAGGAQGVPQSGRPGAKRIDARKDQYSQARPFWIRT